MAEGSGFEFEPHTVAADKRDKLTPAATDDTNSTAGKSTAVTPASIGVGNGIVAALKSTYHAEVQAETLAHDTLLFLGLALFRYEVSSLSALRDCADADPDPPQYVETVLPSVRRLVEQ